MNPDAKLLFDYLRDVIYDPSGARLETEKLSEDFVQLGKALQYFSRSVVEASSLSAALSKGELNVCLPPPENEIAAPLKHLHANLKHMTWQAQQVAGGYLHHRIDYLGEFAEAFNSMAEQLERQRAALLDEIENGRRKARALSQSNSLLEALTAQISQWIVVMGKATSEWLFANHPPEKILCDARCEAEQRLWMKAQAERIENGQPPMKELALRGGGGNQYFSVEIHPLSYHDNSALAFVFTDVSAEREYLKDLRDAAYTDKLTKLHNRRHGMETLQKWIGDGESFVLCFADIDNLKSVNDRYGHAEGDRYITRVAGALGDFAPEAVICRIGGDEFMLLVPGWSPEEAQARFEELRRCISKRGASEAYEQSVSYGVIPVGADNAHSASELLGAADEKMYEYKRAYKLKKRKSS